MSADREIEAGARFEFGANWTRFLSLLDDERVVQAESSLKAMLGVSDLQGKSFLDIGSGSGLFSLAARRLGAVVRSFDFDPQSVACTQELRRRYFPGDGEWRVEEGSALDRSYMESLGQFDIVYSWGVLHHTGAMWLGIENAINCVGRKQGKLFIAIYNDQGLKSRIWWFIKFFYNRLPGILKIPYVATVMVVLRLLTAIKYTFKLKPLVGIGLLFKTEPERGMSIKYDEIDWIGGFPYEFCTFETLSAYLMARGFSVINSKRTTSFGCNEIVVQRAACAE